jgi:mannan polymerase II complex MNN10 subunit
MSPHSTSGRSSPMRGYANGGANNVTWAAAQARSAEVKGYGAFAPRNNNFFNRHLRSISNSLPSFAPSYAEKEKVSRGRWARFQRTRLGQVFAKVGRKMWRWRIPLFIVFALLWCYFLFYVTRKS